MHRRHHLKLKKDMVTIYPGEYYVSHEDVYIYTVLGSCISVCIYDEMRKVGGMNHFMLSGIGSSGESKIDNFLSSNTRYGMAAMEKLINEVLKSGGQRSHLKAKVFGGANMIKVGNGNANIADNNIKFAKWFLEAEEIPVLSLDFGGNKARKIFFSPYTGKAFVKHIVPEQIELKDELNYERKLMKMNPDKETDIELF